MDSVLARDIKPGCQIVMHRERATVASVQTIRFVHYPPRVLVEFDPNEHGLTHRFYEPYNLVMVQTGLTPV